MLRISMAGHRLNHLAHKIDADAVFPTGAGIEQQRHTQRVVLAAQDAGQPDDLDVPTKIRVEDVVAIAGRMG